MDKTFIVDESAFASTANIQPGVYSGDIFAEEEPKPEAEQGSTLGQKIGKAAEYLPMAGSIVGGGLSLAAAPGTAGASLAGGAALAGLGAAAGKAGEQLIKRAVGEEAPKTPAEAAKQIGIEGATTAAIQAVGGKLIEAAAPTFKTLGKQIMKGFAHLDERLSLKVLNDPQILSRAKPLEEAKQTFSKFFEDNGFVYGPKSVKTATGKLALSDNAEDTFIADVIDEIESVGAKTESKRPGQVIQDALAARYAAKDAISRGVRAGNNSRVRLFLEGRNQIDNWLETQLPGFSAVRKEYEEAKIKEAFKPLLPLNKNKETSILGALTAIGASLGTGAVNPVAGVATAAMSSPRLTGLAIQGVSKGAKMGIGSGIANAVGEKLVKEGAEMERKDHPQLTQPQAEEIAQQEIDKDPKKYKKELQKE